MKDIDDPGTIDLEDVVREPVLRPRAIGAWIFAGGFTWGVLDQFDVGCVLEETNYGVATARANMPEVPIRVGVENWKVDELAREPWDLIYGNPPCAAWSQAGGAVFGRDWRDDPRIDCTRRHFTLLEKIRPKFWVWESVPRAFEAGREFVDALTTRALDAGYSVTYLLHDAQYLGLSQRRPRFFFVAHRVGFEPEPPDFVNTMPGVEALRRMNDIGEIDVKFPADLEAILPDIRPGESIRKAWERANPNPVLNARGQISRRPSFAHHRVRSTGPTNTVAGFMLVHPTENRCLTTTEQQQLCGFPATYEFQGSGKLSQIARGVCPTVARWLARGIATSLADEVVTPFGVRVIDLRRPPGSRQDLPRPDVRETPRPVVAVDAAAALAEGETGTGQSPATRHPRAPSAPRSRAGATGSGAYIRELIVMGHGTEDILVLNKEKFPASKASAADVAWNRREVRLRELATRTVAGTGPIVIFDDPRIEPMAVELEDVAHERADDQDESWFEAAPVVVTARSGGNYGGGGAALVPAPAAVTSASDDETWFEVDYVSPASGGLVADPHANAHMSTYSPDLREMPADAPQPTKSKKARESRRFDTTALTERTHGYIVHRDYAAHFFRWGFAKKFVGNSDDVLDVGCGEDFPYVKSLVSAYPDGVPRSYVGVDLNPLPRPPSRKWASYRGEFDFTTRYSELGQFSTIMCFEVIEHMGTADGALLLAGVRECLRDDGVAVLSTPVFNGRAAGNHIHEYTIPELSAAIEAAGLKIQKKYGTFANYHDIKRAATPEQVAVLDAIGEFYTTDVTACFLAPLYPEASRNCVWVLRKM